MDNDNHYVTVEEYQRLLAMAQQKKSGGFVRLLGDVFQMVLFAAAIVGVYFLIVLFIGEPAALPTPPTNAQPPAVQRPVSAPVAQPGTTYGVNSLPSCADVTDTRTACQGAPVEDQAQPAAVQELPTEPPAPTATPTYMAACWTEPGQRPCWLPADQPWQPPADVPATPVVALPAPTDTPMIFSDAACANWRPPLVLPGGCKSE